MNIVVLVKQVPDTWSERKLRADDSTLDRDAADAVINELDDYAIEEGLPLVTPGGRVSLLGIFRGPVPIRLNEDIIFRRLRVYGITGRKVMSTWYTVSRLIAGRRLNLLPLITHELPLDEYRKGFELMESGKCGKIVFKL